MTDERLKIWLSFWKFFLSSVVITGGIAITSTVITAREKETQLKLQVNKQEQDYLQRFMEKALDDNLEKRRRFAQYFASLTTPGIYKDGWLLYLKAIETEVSKTQQRVGEIERELSTKGGVESEIANRELNELRSELRATQQRQRPFAFQDAPLDKLTVENIQCPKGSNARVWAEHVWATPDFQDFPDDYFVTLGCKDINGQKVGPWTSWYSSGTVIQRGRMTDPRNATFTSWYKNGAKAYELQKVDGVDRSLGRWRSDGTPF